MNQPATPAYVRWWRVRGPRRFSSGIKVGFAFASAMFLFVHAGFDAWLFAALLASVGWAFSYRASITPALVGDPIVKDGRVHFGDRHSIALGDVVGAYRVGGAVEIEVKGGDRYTVNRYSTEEADVLLAALGFGGRRRITARLSTPDARFSHIRGGLLALAASIPVATFFFSRVSVLEAATVLALFVSELVSRRETICEVSIGSDGMTIDGERAGVEALQALRGVDRRRRDALVERMQTAADQTTAEVRRRYLDTPGATYRDAAPTTEEAAAVVRSPSATNAERVGAALMLRVAGEPARVRVLAGEMIDDDLRAQLEEIAATEEDEIRKMARRS